MTAVYLIINKVQSKTMDDTIKPTIDWQSSMSGRPSSLTTAIYILVNPET